MKSKEQKQTAQRKSQNKRRDRLRKEGLCIDCGKNPPGESHAVCQPCREYRSRNEAARQKKLKGERNGTENAAS